MSDKIKKLSQAIRLGATFHPQCFDEMHQRADGRDGEVAIIATCALGAAYEAVRPNGIADSRNFSEITYLESRFPELEEKRRMDVDRQGELSFSTLREKIVYWNDALRYSREMIADKLEAAGL